LLKRIVCFEISAPVLVILLFAGPVGHGPLVLGPDALSSGGVCRYGGCPAEAAFRPRRAVKGGAPGRMGSRGQTAPVLPGSHGFSGNRRSYQSNGR
jgi:hypothetical protein